MKRRSGFVFRLLLTVLLASLPISAADSLAGRWDGAVALPNGELKISVELTGGEAAWQGTIDIPQQGATAVPLKNVSFQTPTVHFELEAAPGMMAVFEGKLDGNKIAGTLSQGGMSFPFTLERKGGDEEPPQVLPEGMIPREVLFGNPEKASPQISPDGTRLAYLAPNRDGVLNVWVRTIGKEDDQVITADKKRGVRFFTWQWDSLHVLYIQDRDGDENWHLYQTNLPTKNTRDLTPFEGITAQLVAADDRFPDTMLVGINLRDRRYHDIYRLNLRNGALDLDTENAGDVIGWQADQKLQVRALTASTPDGGQVVRVRDTVTSPWRDFQKWAPEEAFGGVVGFTPDDKALWLISSVGANAPRLVEVDVATGKSRVIAEDPAYDVNNAMVNPKTRAMEAVSFVRAREEWIFIDPGVKADFEALKKVKNGEIHVISRDLADKNWIVSFDMDSAPLSFYSFNRETRAASFLFTNRPRLEKFQLASMKPISFKSRDGLTIHGYLTVPAGKEPKNLPLIVNVHGGPYGRDVWGLDNEIQWMANRGYAVLQINFRGSTGYGKSFLNAGDRQWAGTMHNDVIDGKRWAIKQGIADPKRVCVYGGSYGGYATLVGVTFTPDEFTCGVDIVGPSNLITLLETIPPYWEAFKKILIRRVGDPATEPDFLKSRSPLFKADQIRVPLMVAQGANDPRVKQAESDQIVAAARKNGKDVVYMVFPDEGHGFARPENRLKFYAAAEQFLTKHLGGTAQPPTSKEKWDDLLK